MIWDWYWCVLEGYDVVVDIFVDGFVLVLDGVGEW